EEKAEHDDGANVSAGLQDALFETFGTTHSHRGGVDTRGEAEARDDAESSWLKEFLSFI
ncbi:hypothetical protein HAX54_043819, partial [Datura stramonium]|nr:hypothetical protein [Datura stramonium]